MSEKKAKKPKVAAQKPTAGPKQPLGEQLSEQDLAYVTEYLSDEVLDGVAGGTGGRPFGEAEIGEAG
jgi:hypothetical protein